MLTLRPMSWKCALVAGLLCSHALAAPQSTDAASSLSAPEPAAAALHEQDAAGADVPVPVETDDAGSTKALSHAAVITTALEMIGIPYRRGGTDPQVGFDCSGFVYAMYAQAAGHELPRVAREQAQATQKIARKELQPGDLVFFNTMRRAFSHVGIYLGDGQFIHAPSRGKRVRVENMNARYWTQRFNGARRVHFDAAQASASSATSLSTP